MLIMNLKGVYFRHSTDARTALVPLCCHTKQLHDTSLQQQRGRGGSATLFIQEKCQPTDRVSTMSFYALKATLFRRSFAHASVFASATPLSTPWHTSFVRSFASKKVGWRVAGLSHFHASSSRALIAHYT